MTASRLLERLEDFRLLPVFVIVSMAIGIAIGKALSISDSGPRLDRHLGTWHATDPARQRRSSMT